MVHGPILLIGAPFDNTIHVSSNFHPDTFTLRGGHIWDA